MPLAPADWPLEGANRPLEGTDRPLEAADWLLYVLDACRDPHVLDLGPDALAVPTLRVGRVSEQVLGDWSCSSHETERCDYQVSSVHLHGTLSGAAAEIKHEWREWRQRAAEVDDLGQKLAEFSCGAAAEEAWNSGQNFWLVGSLIKNVETQPVFVHEAFPGHVAIVASVYTIADAGYAFLRSYVRLRRGEQARSRRRHLAVVLAQALTRACENWQSLVARRRTNDRTVHDANPPDSPQRAQPRETRAGPTSKEPSEPGHEPDGCQRGEVRSARPAINDSPAGKVRRRQLLSRSFKTSPTSAGVYV